MTSQDSSDSLISEITPIETHNYCSTTILSQENQDTANDYAELDLECREVLESTRDCGTD